MDSVEKTIRDNYLKALQPENVELESDNQFRNVIQDTFVDNELGDNWEITKTVGSAIKESVKESFDDYANAAVKAVDEGNLPEFVNESLTALGKGAVQGVGGIAGDAEKLFYGLIAIAQTPKGKSKLTEFGKALQKDTFFTNTEDMARHINNLFGTETKEELGLIEGTGEIFAPIGTVAKVATGVGKKLKTIRTASKGNK